jgi:hypothetical protein
MPLPLHATDFLCEYPARKPFTFRSRNRAAERRASRAAPSLWLNLRTLVSAVACMRLLWRSARLPPPAPAKQSIEGRCGEKVTPAPREYLSSRATLNGAKVALQEDRSRERRHNAAHHAPAQA